MDYIRGILSKYKSNNRVLCIDGTSCCKKSAICAELSKANPTCLINDYLPDEMFKTLKTQTNRKIIRPNTYYPSNYGYIVGGMLDISNANKQMMVLQSQFNDNIANKSGSEIVSFTIPMDRSPLNVDEWRLLWILMDEFWNAYGNVDFDETIHASFLNHFDNIFATLRKCTWYRAFRSQINCLAIINSDTVACDTLRTMRNSSSDVQRSQWKFYTSFQNRMYRELYRAMTDEELETFPYNQKIDGKNIHYLKHDCYLDLAKISQFDESGKHNDIHVRLILKALRDYMYKNLDFTTTRLDRDELNNVNFKRFYLPTPSKYTYTDPVEANYNEHVYREAGRIIVRNTRDGEYKTEKEAYRQAMEKRAYVTLCEEDSDSDSSTIIVVKNGNKRIMDVVDYEKSKKQMKIL